MESQSISPVGLRAMRDGFEFVLNLVVDRGRSLLYNNSSHMMTRRF